MARFDQNSVDWLIASYEAYFTFTDLSGPNTHVKGVSASLGATGMNLANLTVDWN